MRTAFLAALGLALASCEIATDPAAHPIGAAILNEDGVEVARFQHGPAGGSGELLVGVGQTSVFRVRLVDGNGNLFRIDGVQHSLRRPTVVQPLFARVELREPDEIAIRGLPAGLGAAPTELIFDVYHGAHREFEVSEISVVVR